MNKNIDDMIDIISSDMPEFLDHTKPEDRDIFSHMSYLLVMIKILTNGNIMSLKEIDEFTESYLDHILLMMECSGNIEKINKSYDYVSSIYMNVMNYLENFEEYEMCHNFKSFFELFNDKTNNMNV